MNYSDYIYTFAIITIISILYILQPVKRCSNRIINSPSIYISIIISLIAFIIMFSLPIEWGKYSDRENYALIFNSIKANQIDSGSISHDNLFYHYTSLISKITDYTGYFFITTVFYIVNYFIASYRMSKRYHYILLLMTFISFMFYAYGTNTIRAGFAISFLLLALTYYQKFWLMAILITISIGCHYSMIIPSIGILISRFFDKTKFYFALWCIAIPLSAIAGNYFEILFASLSNDSRAIAFLTTSMNYNTGFRYDFIIYSCIPICVGYYYIYKKKFKSDYYKLIYNSYILTNIFWILVIRANFSDRFAYLSWFLIPYIIIYPLVNTKLFESQNKKICLILMLQMIFTYTMYIR